MNTTDLVDQYRSEMGDTEKPYLWSDQLIYGYAGDAQKQFCRWTNGISDARTPAVTKLAILPGTQWYETHPSILKVRTVQRTDTGRDVALVNAERMSQFGVQFDGRTGPLKYLVMGLEAHALRAWPIPSTAGRLTLASVGITPIAAATLPLVSSAGAYFGQSVSGLGIAAGTTVTAVAPTSVGLSLATTAAVPAATPIYLDLTIEMTVFRLPLTAITDDGDQALEIDEQHHSHLLLWMKHLGYDKQDAETFDRRKSDDFAQRFNTYCAEAKKEQDRARRVVGAVAYGGI